MPETLTKIPTVYVQEEGESAEQAKAATASVEQELEHMELFPVDQKVVAKRVAEQRGANVQRDPELMQSTLTQEQQLEIMMKMHEQQARIPGTDAAALHMEEQLEHMDAPGSGVEGSVGMITPEAESVLEELFEIYGQQPQIPNTDAQAAFVEDRNVELPLNASAAQSQALSSRPFGKLEKMACAAGGAPESYELIYEQQTPAIAGMDAMEEQISEQARRSRL